MSSKSQTRWTRLLNWSTITPMGGGGCYTGNSAGGDVGVGALLFEKALVFLDVTFLGGIIEDFAHFLSKNRPKFFL